jgi:hypothetical protein
MLAAATIYMRRYRATAKGRAATRRANRAWQKRHQKERDRTLRFAAIQHYGGRCAEQDGSCLGELEIDHIAGDGVAHREREKFARNIGQWLKAKGYPRGFQVLCHSHNVRKAKRGGEAIPFERRG